MKQRRFPKMKAGKWVQPVKQGYLFACCDCCLVHRMDFRTDGKKIQFRVWRADRHTAQLRKVNKITMITDSAPRGDGK
jgi:Zn-finger protein